MGVLHRTIGQMLPHPHLWPPLIGAALGFALILWASFEVARRWDGLGRRARWRAFAAVALFETAYWLNVYAWLIEPNLLIVQRVEIVSENWRGAPITIAALGDTHVPGPHMSVARMGAIVARVNTLRPDLVLLLGDYVASHESEAERSSFEQSQVLAGIATFADLSAPLGVVGVLGNHDAWYSRESVTRALEEAGVAALWDRHVVISRPSGDVVIAGLADDDTADPQYSDAIDGAPADGDTIVLSHTPDMFVEVPPGPALMLGAHSHCGQVTIPLIGRPILPLQHRRFACHRIDEAGKIIFVTAGLGTSYIPVRFLNPPEIVLIHLRGAPAAD